MSQRTQSVNEEIIVELKFKVTINSFNNHNGFKEGQIEQAIEEFKENIQKELEYKVNGEYTQQEFLQTVDYVSYEADSQNGL
jgi:NADPH-dependent 7-cyano-7-deazaguanine reductase QueF